MIGGVESEAIGVFLSYMFFGILIFWLVKPKKIILLFIALDFIVGSLVLPPIYNIPNFLYHHDLSRNFEGKELWGNVRYKIITNSLGFKDNRKRLIELVTAKYRILFIGDSFTEGVGYSYDDTYVGIIDKELGRENFEILNAGVVTYSPKLYYEKIKYLVEKKGLKFDELYVYLDISDMTDDAKYENLVPYKNKLISFLIGSHCFLKRHLITYRVYNSILYRSRILYRLFEDKQGAAIPDGDNKYVYSERNMNKLYDLCKANRIEMNIAVYPYPAQVREGITENEYVRFWKNFCADRNINFINYYPDFINEGKPDIVIDKYFLANDPHWNNQGQKKIAYKWLKLFDKDAVQLKRRSVYEK